MNIFLDDLRVPSDEWVLVASVEEAIDALKTGEVNAISLDNDLGPSAPEGYTVVDWMIENEVYPSLVFVHSSNPVAVNRMTKALVASGEYTDPVPVDVHKEAVITLMFERLT